MSGRSEGIKRGTGRKRRIESHAEEIGRGEEIRKGRNWQKGREWKRTWELQGEGIGGWGRSDKVESIEGGREC